MKKLLIALLVLTLAVTSSEAARPIRFTMSLGDNEQSNYYKGAMAIVEAVKEATDGRIVINVRAGGTLSGVLMGFTGTGKLCCNA